MKQFYKPDTDLKIRYFEEDDFIVKQLSDGELVIYEQRLINSPCLSLHTTRCFTMNYMKKRPIPPMGLSRKGVKLVNV